MSFLRHAPTGTDSIDNAFGQDTTLIQGLRQNLTATLAAAVLSVGSLSGVAVASEFDVINTSTPSLNYLIDDAGVLNKTTKKAVNDRLYKLEVNCQQCVC